MSCSKPLPPFAFDVLCCLNRDQLERFSIVCYSLKNLIERYFRSKPYRVFDNLEIRYGKYALVHNRVQWHLNRDDYSVQQFLAGKICIIDESKDDWDDHRYYLFDEMRPYFGPTVRIKKTTVGVVYSINYSELITEMESIAYLWRDGEIFIEPESMYTIDAEDLQPFLKSPTILQCQHLFMLNAHFSFKDYKILYAVDVIGINYINRDFDPNSWLQFLEQPGAKPVVLLKRVCRESIDNVLDCISKTFYSAILPNAFKIVFIQSDKELTEFREPNKNSGEILELKKELPVEYQTYWDLYHDYDKDNNYTLERSRI